MFGSSQQQSGAGLFGAQSNTQSGGLFGQGAQPQQQSTGGLFGGAGQNTQQQQNQTQPNQQAPAGGLFSSLQGNQQNTQQSGGLFGQSTQQQGSLFKLSQQQQQPEPLPPLGKSTALWQPNSAVTPREKSVPDQISTVVEKWDTNSLNCSFQYYFYNKVPENMVPYYRPGPNEDPKAWDEALSKKPGPGFIPVLCNGFAQLGQRIQNQQRNLAEYNTRLHEINNSLSAMLQSHETKTSIRAMDAKRKHVVLRQRCITLATKVQVLRNRGYALGGDEEDLKSKLQALEKGVSDPGLGARAEEIWARMLTVQERARLLKSEIEKSGAEAPDMLDEEISRRAKKILEDYDRQLIHLKKELDAIQKEYKEWEIDHPAPPAPGARVNGY